jgi:uncharacterized protein YecE (DUF72 family)
MQDIAHAIVLVGVGGWAYLPVRHQNKLEVCSKVFDFVEVNSSFYKLPPIKQALKWRASVPETFEFTVRANGKLTHANHLGPTEENFRLFNSNMAICDALRSTILHFQFPPSFQVTREVVNSWRDFFNSIRKNRATTDFAFEIRNAETANASYLESFFEDYDIIPTTDASKGGELQTSSRSKIMYSRVFGHGDHTKWSFSTNELEQLKEKVENVPAKRRYVTFHNISMYEDGARLKNLIKEGKDKLPSGEVGLDSLRRSMIAARLKFPITKEALMRDLSWRTIDLDGERVHTDKVLKGLPEESSFRSVDDVLRLLPSIGLSN